MRLSNIKLSGFKSFVDPTTLKVPGNLVGIVGPNGCGKSNIIDALMWVMGESSAKHLRGDALTDVIFNGSSQRKPVGQAAVEIIFDNTENKLGGQYASYNEISIKRQINRDGISTYYLNGTRCRRRDITAIFLGTGLGPRSYAIIEQGMISRLIDAKPDELRVFIEEAAGISKYRERRRETENRIKHTKENISRINDIREELEKQLGHLQRQAKAAERFQVLKKEERRLKAESLALVWRDLKKESDQKKELVSKRENVVESGMAELRAIEANIEKEREEAGQATERFSNVQAEYYSVGSEISQLEQKIQHTHEKKTTLNEDLRQARTSLEQTRGQQTQDKHQLESLNEELAELEPKLQGSKLDSNNAYELLNEAESAMQGWQNEWDAFNQSCADFDQQGQIDQTRIDHLESGINEILNRRKQLNEELSSIESDDLNQQIEHARHEFETRQSTLEKIRLQLEEAHQSVVKGREQLRTITDQRDEARSDQQLLKGKLASLEALQEINLGKNDEVLESWLQQNNIANSPRLAEQIEIDAEWIRALETVSGSHLQNLCVSDLEPLLHTVNDLELNIGLVSGKHQAEKHDRWVRLVEKIKNDIALPAALESVYIARDLNTALSMRTKLNPHESVVTAEGIWLGLNWLVVNRGEQNDAGMLSREQEINSLRSRLQEVNVRAESLETRLNDCSSLLEQTEKTQNESQQEMQMLQTEMTELRGTLASGEAQSEQRISRKNQLEEELELLLEQEESDREEVRGIKQRLASIDEDKDKLKIQRQELTSLREAHRQSLDKARSNWQSTHEESHGIALQLESFSSRRASLDQAIKRNDIQLSHLDNRCKELKSNLSNCLTPLQDLENELKQKLGEKVAIEKMLGEARSDVQAVESNLRNYEQSRSQCEQKIQELRTQLEQARLAVNECKVRLQTVEEQLSETEHNATDLLATLNEDAKQSDWKEKLESVARKIHRLGPINLAAIDEFTQLSERKTYLDSQYNDLNEALTTLENAISKIDRETRTRFKETFDDLNNNLKEMFPKLFGGGHAYLELTGNDLLETGVTVMARPPGKRNSTIHLLSGGEKALTAVALVFAIFKLNPAPFCILDEVDAPLDDTNTGRFCELVISMSDEVQFIIITHNKITMEITQQLLGVTMHEAGVSRLVSVDMDEAVEMAATA